MFAKRKTRNVKINALATQGNLKTKWKLYLFLLKLFLVADFLRLDELKLRQHVFT